MLINAEITLYIIPHSFVLISFIHTLHCTTPLSITWICLNYSIEGNLGKFDNLL